MFQEAFAEVRANPRGGQASKTSVSQNITSRDTKEIQQREDALDNSHINRETSMRGVVSNDRVGTRAIARSASNRGMSTPIIRSNATTKASTAARAAVRAATINAIASGTTLPVARTASSANASRATTLFQNTNVLGADYNQCRETYFSCMDQFCGMKSDQYRRCLCSQKFREFKDKEDAYEQAKQLITEFNDNNLNVVGLSAEEASALYSSSAGESAIKTDTSASAKMLATINDLLSGKTKATESAQKSVPTTLDLNFSPSNEDIWNNNDNSDLFANDSRSQSTVSLENLEGTDLFNEVHKQCMELASVCDKNQATKNMVVSSYSVLISQDCSTYEKKLDAQKSALESAIREGTKLLMEARLDDFRAHNSASVNQCIAAVRASVLDQYACGPNWERCLDFSGLYINTTTGDPIYSPQLFKLADTINLNNMNDPDNQVFLSNLDGMKNRATSALNTCRNEADTVWDEFKQQALIEISQAQDAKIEAVKSSCVTTMKECYDKQTGALDMFSEVSSSADLSGVVQSTTAALGQRAARAMCMDQVIACAALYGDPDGCSVDDNGKVSDTPGRKCGLASLLSFVDTVDDTKTSVLCKSELQRYMTEQCTPRGGTQTPAIDLSKECDDTDGTAGCSTAEINAYRAKIEAADFNQMKNSYPYACRSLPMKGQGSVYELLVNRAAISCTNENGELDSTGKMAVKDVMDDIESRIKNTMRIACKNVTGQYVGKGIWLSNLDSNATAISVIPEWAEDIFGTLEDFANTVSSNTSIIFGEVVTNTTANQKQGQAVSSSASSTKILESADLPVKSWGYCALAEEQMMCERLNYLVGTTVATYDSASRVCRFGPDYAKTLCGFLPDSEWNANTNECSYVPE